MSNEYPEPRTRIVGERFQNIATGALLITLSIALDLLWWTSRQVVWFHYRDWGHENEAMIHGITTVTALLSLGGIVLGVFHIWRGYHA